MTSSNPHIAPGIRPRASAKRQGIPVTTLPPTRTLYQAPEPVEEDEILDEGYNPYRLPTSAIRYDRVSSPRPKQFVIPFADGTYMRMTERELDNLPPEYQKAAQLDIPRPLAPAAEKEPHTEEAQRVKPRRSHHPHWLFIFGIGMLAMLALWVALSTAITWAGHKLDDMTYGMPRTYQIDAAVGHNNDSSTNPSHFIFLNLNGHIEVIEQPAGDASKAKIYYGPTLYSDDASFIPATGEFADVNGDGKPDMIIKIQNSRIVFINENGAFRPLRPGERITLPKD